MSNVISFASIFFLVAAICSIVYRVEVTTEPENSAEENQAKLQLLNSEIDLAKDDLQSQTDEAKKLEFDNKLKNLKKQKKEIKDDLEKFVPFKEHLRLILYAAGAMLFVGLSKINTVTEWHRLFVNSDYSVLLENFFKISHSVQAGFYSLLLATIYIPAAYWIWKKEGNRLTGESTTWFSSFSKYAAPLITIISPLLAKPFSDLLTSLFGS